MATKVYQITNLKKKSRTFVIPHRPCCIKAGRCGCINGQPRSLHLSAEEVRDDIPEEYLFAPDIVQAKNGNPPTIKVTSREVKKVEEAKAPAPADKDAKPSKPGAQTSGKPTGKNDDKKKSKKKD